MLKLVTVYACDLCMHSSQCNDTVHHADGIDLILSVLFSMLF